MSTTSATQPSSARTDREIAEALLSGDAPAIATVRMWVRRSLSRYRRLIADDADDVEQDVLLSLLKTLEEERFRFDSRLETYVARMVHYRCIDRLRQRSKRRLVPIEGLELEDAEADPAEGIASRQSVGLALRVAAALPDGCRELWRMIHQGMSYADMAERTGVAPATLRVRVLRCRRKATALRDQMSREGGGS